MTYTFIHCEYLYTTHDNHSINLSAAVATIHIMCMTTCIILAIASYMCSYTGY